MDATRIKRGTWWRNQVMVRLPTLWPAPGTGAVPLGGRPAAPSGSPSPWLGSAATPRSGAWRRGGASPERRSGGWTNGRSSAGPHATRGPRSATEAST